MIDLVFSVKKYEELFIMYEATVYLKFLKVIYYFIF